MADYIWVRNESGAEYPVVASAFDPAVHTKVEGAAVARDANGRPVRVDTEPTAPSKSDNKAAWVAYAVSQGADPEQSEAATKADLIAEYGNE